MLSDKDIIIKIKNGEIDYFSLIVKKYSSLIYQYIKLKIKNKEDAEDLVQNVFISFYKVIDRFDEQKLIKPYLFQIVNNELKMFYRKYKKILPLTEDIYLQDDRFIDNFNDEDIMKILKKLKSQEKKIIMMIVDGYSYKDIAKKFKKPVNTVKSIIRRIRLKLRSLNSDFYRDNF